MKPTLSRIEVHDIGTQCCFEPVTQRSVAIQTDTCNTSVNAVGWENGKVGGPPLTRGPLDTPHHVDTCAAEWKVVHDHNYAMNVPKNVIFPTYDHDSFNIPIPPQHGVNAISSEDTADAFVNGNESDADDGDDNDDEDMDPNWQLPDDDKILSDDDIVPPEDEL